MQACWPVPRWRLAAGAYYDVRVWGLGLTLTMGDPWSAQLRVGPFYFEFGGYPG